MGTLYCLHRDEERLIGSDPVPCPFCGFGTEQEHPVGSDPIEALDIDDSSSALQHALTSSNEQGRSPSATSGRQRQGLW